MAIPNATHQVASDAIAALGGYISLHTGAGASTTGANEATGGSYARQLSSPWVPSGVGDNSGPQVNIPCAAGTYVEAGIFTTLTGTSLSAPTSLAATGSGTGGTLAANTYYYKVTAYNHAGETIGSTEDSETVSGSTSKIDLSWTAVTGATGYKVYRGTSSNGQSVRVATVTTNSYSDTGSAGTAATVPESNTASTFIGSAAFTGGSVTVSGSGASINVSPTITA